MIFIFIITIPLLLFSYDINEIQIKGNKITKDDIILREIMHPMDIPFNDSIRIKDQNRLYNLGIFSSVEIKQIKNTYQINLIEMFRIIPLPLFDLDESKTRDRTSYGFGLNILNLNGKNRNLAFGLMLGNKNIYYLRFTDPWYFKDRISISSNIYKNSKASFYYENSNEVYLNHITEGFDFGIGFNHKLKESININVGFFKNKIKFNDVNIDYIQPDYQNLLFDINYTYDSRDIYIDPSNGELFKLNINHNQKIKNKSLSYSHLAINWSNFHKIFNYKNMILNIKTKLLIQGTKHIPIFNYYSLGGEDFVRGYNPYPSKNNVKVQSKIRNTQLLSQSLELQYTLIKKNNFDGIEFGIDNLIFIDIGYGSYELGEIFKKNPLVGYGFGFKFFFSGVGVVSIDFGFNQYSNKPEIHISDGQDEL
ncbi:MAG: BamA/TamA family outer membrane protein [Candidatus Neomarinimicrobiota bacterium]|nr:BamA/TamA family outer membrane protein [Candidatus Neomarinimicrobiota bacterium]